jgi:hypothetical protein
MQAPTKTSLVSCGVTALALLTLPGLAAAADAGTSSSNSQRRVERSTSDVKGEQPQKNAQGAPAIPNGKAGAETGADTLFGMFRQGTFDGNLRFYDFKSHNAFFTKDDNGNTATYGGKLGFTTDALKGFSLRLAFYAQRGIDHSEDPGALAAYALAPDINALGEAYLQWKDDDIRVRLGDQPLDAPFTSSTDFRIVQPTFRGATLHVGDDDNFLAAMRIFRYKSYISESFDKTTTYNASYAPFGVNTTETTNGFWALGGGHNMDAGPINLKGQAWLFNYIDYAKMFYADGQIARASGSIKPFFGLQFIRETDSGRALVGDIDHHTYGAQVGLKHKSLTATLNYDYIPHRPGTFLNGSLVTPYAHNVASGPYFAQPFLTSTQDLGSGSAYSADINGGAFKNTFLGARYSYMDLVASAGSDSIEQSEYLVYGIYNFKGALAGLSLANFFGYQTQSGIGRDFWQNRIQLQYEF